MRKDSLFLILICFLLIFTICEKVLAKRKGVKKRFSPLSNISLDKDSFSEGDELIINAKGLIANYNSLYSIKLENESQTYFLEIKDVEAEKLILRLPEFIAYGDYRLNLKLQSNFLKSENYLIKDKVRIRPQAIRLNIKSDHVFFSNNDLKSYLLEEISNLLNEKEIDSEDLVFYINGKLFEFNSERLAEGINKLNIAYLKDDYESLTSKDFEFMFLTKYLYEEEIYMSDSRLELVRRDTEEALDISAFVVNTKDYVYVKAYPNQESFKTELKINKFSITELKVTGDEYAVIQNNSNEFQSLANCSLADTLKLRYSFPREFELAPDASIKIKENLGLNNSSSDKLQMICEYGSEEPEFVIEDVFSYSEVDESGFAVKSE